jgi:hypothetical protein
MAYHIVVINDNDYEKEYNGNKKILVTYNPLPNGLQFIQNQTHSNFYYLLTDKDTNKRARNMKLASIFFKASAVYVRCPQQRY